MGRVDVFHSRRANYAKCPFWVRDERDATESPQEWIYMNAPSGSFYGRPISAKSNQMDVVNGVWALDANKVTLETDDEVPDIARGCLVRYSDELWIVESVQKQAHWKESEFSKHQDYRYIISITKG